jgi:glyoxylase-like metal-dependent hydrolase (beta-lactamase superfamily II)
MTIHHLNCGSIFSRFPRVQAITYCLLVETNQGLVLVDTGFGTQDYTTPSRWMRIFTFLMRVPRNVEETAVHQVRELGFSIEDVKHIVLTHLHLDHAGGLRDFPDASVHVYKAEYEAALKPRGLIERGREKSHWAHNPRWMLHDQPTVDFYGFASMPILDGLSPEIRLVPLTGHTRGHCGVAVETPTGWLFQCGDAASPFHRDADPHLRVEAKYISWKPMDMIIEPFIGSNVPRLRQLVLEHGDEVELISGHDIFSFTRYTS